MDAMNVKILDAMDVKMDAINVKIDALDVKMGVIVVLNL